MNNKAITFNQINDLKKCLKEKYSNYDCVLEYTFDKEINKNDELQYNELLDSLYGIYPGDLSNFLSKRSQEEIIRIKYSTSQKKFSDLWKNEQCPPPQLANYEWRYTDESVKKITKLMTKYQKIACLGTPSVALGLIKENKGKNTTLFDVNKPMILELSRKYKKSEDIECVKYDVVDDIPENYLNLFDVVTINPPWYYDYYCLFIFRSLQMLNKCGSDVILPLFPILSRRNAIQDLEMFFEFVKKLGCTDVESLGYVEFDMPPFEEQSLKESNIAIPNYNWRKAELVKISFKKEKANGIVKVINIDDHIKWESKVTSSNKLYLINSSCIHNTPVGSCFMKQKILDISRSSRSSCDIAIWDVDDNTIIKSKKN